MAKRPLSLWGQAVRGLYRINGIGQVLQLAELLLALIVLVPLGVIMSK